MASWLIGEMRPGSAGLRQENLSIILNYEFLVQTDDKTTTREQVLYQLPQTCAVSKQNLPAVFRFAAPGVYLEFSAMDTCPK